VKAQRTRDGSLATLSHNAYLVDQATARIRAQYLAMSETYRADGKTIVAEVVRLIAERGHKITTCAGIRRDLGLAPATLASALVRGTGHGSRWWLDNYRLAIVQQLRERASLSQAKISELMNATSPQSFGRWLHRTEGYAK
jgi:transcriptional regulator GlxA family with amidase domain